MILINCEFETKLFSAHLCNSVRLSSQILLYNKNVCMTKYLHELLRADAGKNKFTCLISKLRLYFFLILELLDYLAYAHITFNYNDSNCLFFKLHLIDHFCKILAKLKIYEVSNWVQKQLTNTIYSKKHMKFHLNN